MCPPAEDSPTLSISSDESPLAQPQAHLEDMAELTREESNSSVDSMATVATVRPSAVTVPADAAVDFTRETLCASSQTVERSASQSTASTMSGAITPKHGLSGDELLISGAGGPSGAYEDADMLHFEADIESMRRGKRIETPVPSCQHQLHNHPRRSWLGLFKQQSGGAQHFEFSHPERCDTNSSIFTSEPPPLTSAGSSRVTTFNEPPPLFDESGLTLSESPATTPGFGHKIVDFKEWLAELRLQDRKKRSMRILRKEPSPLGKYRRIKNGTVLQFDDYRSPKPPISDSGDSDSEKGARTFDDTRLPAGLESDNNSCWSESESSDDLDEIDENHPFYDIKLAVVRQALLEYQQWTSLASGGDNPAPTAEHPTSGSSGQTPGNGQRALKRNRSESDAGGGEDGEDPGERRPKKQAASSGNAAAPLQQLFACPYAKVDQSKYEKCYGYVLKRIKDVKQHIERVHKAPVYCTRCREQFQSEAEREAHSRRQEGCERSDRPEPEGMTPAQEERLKRRVRSKGWKEQWYEIFDIFFEGVPHPKSPYVPEELNLKLRRFMDMMHERGSDIIMESITRSELMDRLEGMGLRADEEEQHIISSLLATSISHGLQEITTAWQSARGSDQAVPSLTEAETLQSSTQPADNLRASDTVPVGTSIDLGSGAESLGALDYAKSNDGHQNPGYDDNLVHYPDRSTLATPTLNGGEWTNPELIDPNLCTLPTSRSSDQEQFWNSLVSTEEITWDQAR